MATNKESNPAVITSVRRILYGYDRLEVHYTDRGIRREFLVPEEGVINPAAILNSVGKPIEVIPHYLFKINGRNVLKPNHLKIHNDYVKRERALRHPHP